MSSSSASAQAAAATATSITKFKVFARVRPFIPSEIPENTTSTGQIRSIVEMVDQTKTVLLDPKEDYAPKAQFEFDEALWSIPADYKIQKTFADTDKKQFASQAYVYEKIGKGAAEAAFEGINSSIMSYGQTGSGKTYTMMGNYDPYSVSSAMSEGEEGIIPRVCHDVFHTVDQKRKEQLTTVENEKDRKRYIVEVTFVEVYMETVRDLLDPALAKRAAAAARDGTDKPHATKEARIRNDPESGPYVEDVTKYQVENWAHCCTLLERGSAQRRTSANIVHAQSSRSHAIFTITVMEQQDIPAKDKYSPPTVKTRTGRINLVDLAGSERGGMTDYVKESSKINTSLLSLRRVIDNLVERQNLMMEQMKLELERDQAIAEGKPEPIVPAAPTLPQVPFRDSVLTWLLSDSIGGNARTTMLAALSPHQKNYGDTLATLQWSSKARGLVSVVKANDVQTNVQQGYNSKLTDLQSTLHSTKQNVDSIKKEMSLKQSMAEELEEKIKQTMRKNVQTQQEKEERETLAAALAVQRAWRHWRHRVRMDGLYDTLAQKQKSIDESTTKSADLSTQIAAALAAAAAQKTVTETEREGIAADKVTLDKYEADEEEFAVKFDDAKKRRDEAERGIGLNEVRERQEKESSELEEKEQTVSAQLTEATERRDTMATELREMEERVDAAGSEEERAKTMKGVEEMVAATRSKESGVIAELKAKKAELEKKKKDLQAELDKKTKKK